MIRWYTCLKCGFPFMADDAAPQEACPTCNAPADQILSEPLIPGKPRRIHVDAPEPDPTWNRMDASYHCPKNYPDDSTHHQLRKFILEYTEPYGLKAFYERVFDWDIVDTRVNNPIHPLFLAATGPGSKNWEPIAPSFIYGLFNERSETPAPSFVIDTDDMSDSLAKIENSGGHIISTEKRIGTVDIAVAQDCEGNVFCLWHTPDGERWNFFNKEYTPEVLGRAPKRYPRRSLHGRVRGISLPYDDDERMRKFYIEVFDWDFYRMPPYFFGEEYNVYWAATGPTQASWESSMPGHITATFVPRELSDKSYLWLEVDSCREAVEMTLAAGGKLISGRTDGKDWDESVGESGGDWANMAVVEDYQGNRLLFWQCPGSRTWEEPESIHDMDFEK